MYSIQSTRTGDDDGRTKLQVKAKQNTDTRWCVVVLYITITLHSRLSNSSHKILLYCVLFILTALRSTTIFSDTKILNLNNLSFYLLQLLKPTKHVSTIVIAYDDGDWSRSYSQTK